MGSIEPGANGASFLEEVFPCVEELKDEVRFRLELGEVGGVLDP